MNLKIFGAITFLIFDLVACRAKNTTTASNASVAVEEGSTSVKPDSSDFVIGDYFDMTSEEWDNLKQRNKVQADTINNVTTPAIQKVITACIDIVRRYDKLSGDYALGHKEADADLLAQINLRNSLMRQSSDISDKRLVDQNSRDELTGKIKALELAIQIYGVGFREKLAKHNRILSDVIADDRIELRVIEKKERAILAKTPFDESAFDAEVDKEEALGNKIAEAVHKRSEILSMLRKDRVKDLVTLYKKLTAVVADFASNGPKLTQEIQTSTNEIRRLDAAIVAANNKIEMSSSYAKIVLPSLPSKCALLGIH